MTTSRTPSLRCVEDIGTVEYLKQTRRSLATRATIVGGNPSCDDDYRVEKMKYGAKKDQTTLHYNGKITIKDIPLEAYNYVVNGKPALDWVVERQCVKTDKTSGIVNDANDWAIDTMQNPKYPFELFLRVITVSLETMKIVRSLPALDILDS